MKKLNFKDIYYVFGMRIKLIVKDRITILVLLSSVVLFSLIIHSLVVSAEYKSAIPIGIVDYDHSESSQKLMRKIDEVPFLSVIQGNEKELKKKLLDEMILGLFVIKDGYEDNITTSENLEKLIKMYYVEGNKSASIISDIVAGEMMYDVCFHISRNYYHTIKFDGKKHSDQEYTEYIRHLVGTSTDFDFAFQTEYVNPEKTVKVSAPIKNSVLYNQLIIGMLGILIAFIAMFIISGTVREKETGISKRLGISSFHIAKQDLGNYLALIITEGIIAMVFCGFIFAQLNTNDWKLWTSVYLLLLLNAVIYGGIFIILAKFTKSIIVFQLIGSIFILLMGGLGFYNILAGMYQNFADYISKIIPNSWFIQGFTDIIIYGKNEGYIKTAHLIMFFMTIALIAVILLIDYMKIKKIKVKL